MPPSVASQPPDPKTPDWYRRRILVLKPVNKSESPDEMASQQALDEIRAFFETQPDYVFVGIDELDGTDGYYTGFGDFYFPRIFEGCRGQGVAGVLAPTIEDMGVREGGDEVGIFRNRNYTSFAKVRLRLFDVATQREVFSRLGEGETTEERMEFLDGRAPDNHDVERSKQAMTRALAQALQGLTTKARKVAWVGRIARRDLHRYYVNGGELTGIRRGSLLRVFEESEPVMDPQTARPLGLAPGRFKGLLKVVELFGNDASIAVVHSGAGFREEDRVEVDITPPK